MEKPKHRRSNSVTLPKQDIIVLKDVSHAARLRRCMTVTGKKKDVSPPSPPPRVSKIQTNHQDMPFPEGFLTLPRLRKPPQNSPTQDDEFLTLPRLRKQPQKNSSPNDEFLTLPRLRKPPQKNFSPNDEFLTLPSLRKPPQKNSSPNDEFLTLPRLHKPVQNRPSVSESTFCKPSQDMCSPNSSNQSSLFSTMMHKPAKPPTGTNEVSTTRQPELVKATLRHSLSVNRLKLPPNEPISLSQFITKYSNFLPTQVQVCKGFCSSYTDLSISQNETFNFHFIKHTKVISMRDGERKMEFSVPLNSSVEFGLIYNPNQNEEEAMNGFYFETAADLMSMSSLPTVVRATKNYGGGTHEDSVSADELLIVKGVKPSFIPGKGMQLHVCSTTHSEKYLQGKCAGGFTTKPQHVALPLSSLIEHQFHFPQKAVICADKELNSTLPSTMSRSSIVLEGYKGETSMIATSMDGIAGPVFEISSDIGIQIEALDQPESNQRQLVDNSLALYKTFDASNLQVLTEKPSSRAYDLQLLLYTKVDRDKKPDGVQLVLPLLLPDNEPADKLSDQSKRVIKSSSPNWENETVPVSTTLQAPFLLPSCLSPVPSIVSTADSMYQAIDSSQMHGAEYVHMETKVKPSITVQAHNDSTHNQLLDVVEQSEGDFKGGVVQISEQLEKLKAKVDVLGKMVGSTTSTDISPPSSGGVRRTVGSTVESSSDDIAPGQSVVYSKATLPPGELGKIDGMKHHDDLPCQQNWNFLASLDYNQVQLLLDAMNLSQYKEAFQQEQVSGEILLECDEDILERELHVSSRIHRIRLMKIINGKTSAQDYLNINT